ncbi:hypothetical protein HPB49_010827 [Dermacentor silvarum]|uniref:Uncharacterized protein n=1 Tax=Dermacentor silvarum TaxID=543639 RepID=A0ACB8CKQ2_DERSI|nr:hypothetical protein HPB49_010827 [Dermacentor silvarum]
MSASSRCVPDSPAPDADVKSRASQPPSTASKVVLSCLSAAPAGPSSPPSQGKVLFSNFMSKIMDSDGNAKVNVVTTPRRTFQRKPQLRQRRNLDAMRLRQLLDRSSLTPLSLQSPQQSTAFGVFRRNNKGGCLFFGALFAAVAITVVVLQLSGRGGLDVCRSEVCHHYSKLLADSLDTKADPCHDFHRYVCAGWEGKHHQSVMSAVYQRFIESVGDKADRTRVPPMGQTAVQKAVKFYQSCRSVYTDGNNDLKAVRAVLAQTGVLWPKLSNSSQLLRMLLRMTGAWNWGAVVELLTDKPGEFTVRPSMTYHLTLQRRRAMLKSADEGKYRKYFNQMVEAFGGPDVRAEPFEALIELEETVVPRLQRFYEAPYWSSLDNASLDDVAEMTRPSVSQAAWVEQLRAHFGELPAENFYVENREYFTAFFDLVAEVGESKMAYYVGWATVQIMALFSNAELISYYYLSMSDAESGHALFCTGLAHSYMGVAFYAGYVRDEIGWNDMQGVIDIVRSIRYSYSEGLHLASSPFGSLISSVPWLSGSARDQQDELTMGVVASAQSDDTLNSMYQEFPSMTDSVLDNIVSATAARRRTLVNTRMERFSANQSHRVLHLRSDQFEFLPTAFEVPLFHAGAPAAANYGALGSEIANAFSALLYQALRRSDNETWSAFAERASCMSDAASPTDGSGPRLEDLQHLSDVQLLFVVWCYSQCGRLGARRLCNEPVAVFRAFGEAFSCSTGSPMNSRGDCTFLE